MKKDDFPEGGEVRNTKRKGELPRNEGKTKKMSKRFAQGAAWEISRRGGGAEERKAQSNNLNAKCTPLLGARPLCQMGRT